MLLRRWPDPVLDRPVPACGRELLARPAELAELAHSLVEAMEAHDGVGLAANQIGIGRAAFCAQVPGYRSPLGPTLDGVLVLMNPDLLEHGGAQPSVEGCLSVPGTTRTLLRPAWVSLEGYDPTGTLVRLRLRGDAARIACHELDHLAGTTILAPGLVAGASAALRGPEAP